MPAVEQCPHRDQVQFEGAAESSRCGLLSQIVNCGEELSAFRVPRAACETCVEGVPPRGDRLNSVLASFLYSATLEILERGGTAQCEVADALKLQERAKSHLQREVVGRRSPTPRPRSFQDCGHLGRVAGYRLQPSFQGMIRTAVHACHHPAHETTTEADCNACRDFSQKPDSPTARLAELLPQPVSWAGGDAPTQWAVGMTTAPRRTPTLEMSLDYLRRAGWSQVRLAVDGQTRLPPMIPIEQVSLRTPALGAWPNFYLTLLELVLSEPAANAFLMVQDDAVFYDGENVRTYLESLLWPTQPAGIVSLYCSAAYTRETAGWTVADQRWEWGALAFVFPAELARRFVGDPRVIAHRATNRGLRFIDDVIGEWAERNHIPIWYPTPSLVQHVGETSTVWPGVAAAGYRRADVFAGDL